MARVSLSKGRKAVEGLRLEVICVSCNCCCVGGCVGGCSRACGCVPLTMTV